MDRLITRKEFVRTGVLRAGEVLATIVQRSAAAIGRGRGREAPPSPPSPRWVRPPGAIPEEEFLRACSRCDDCLRACPHWVIRKAGAEVEGAIPGSPIIVPGENSCRMCADLPCIAACASGALLPPGDGERPAIGVAVVEEERCYMSRGQPCDYCTVHCPEEPKAIDTSERGRAAVVAADRCTGCGKCAEICPTGAIGIDDHRRPVGEGAR